MEKKKRRPAAAKEKKPTLAHAHRHCSNEPKPKAHTLNGLLVIMYLLLHTDLSAAVFNNCLLLPLVAAAVTVAAARWYGVRAAARLFAYFYSFIH